MISAPPAPPVAQWRTYRRLTPYLMPYRGRLLFVLALSLMATAVTLAQPYLSKLMIDEALLGHNLAALWWIAAATIGVTLGGYILNIASSYRYVKISAAMLFDIRVDLLRHLQTLSPRFYARFRLGDLMSRINSDVSDVQRAAADTLLAALGNVLFLIGSVVLMLWLDWRLFLVGTVLVPIAVLAFVRLQRRLVEITREMRERGADLGSLLVDTVMGMRVVTALRAEGHELARFAGANGRFVETMLRMQVASFLTGALPGALLAISTAAVTLYGGWRVFSGELTIGTLVAFMAYHARLFAPVQALLGLSSGLASTRVSLGRIFELFDTLPEVSQRADPLPMGPVRSAIRFEGVHFRHDREAVLDGVDLAIPAGALCAVLGESGAGKSTLADLLVRLQDPQSGRITIDGVDIRDVGLDDLRREVLLVDQAPFLFNATIGANIAFALESATTIEVQAAAEAAGLGALLQRLPEGLQTPVGERGQSLSAGERQRIAIARALLRRPSVLVLDEPTAALDAATERRVAEGLREALPDATLIIITHRPALTEGADMVVTLTGGKASLRD